LVGLLLGFRRAVPGMQDGSWEWVVVSLSTATRSESTLLTFFSLLRESSSFSDLSTTSFYSLFHLGLHFNVSFDE
jgi:hypothetical protein